MEPLVLALADPRVTLALGGGKAANLGTMIRAGLPVPDGVVVTTEAWRAFVASHGLATRLAAAWGEARDGSAETVERVAAEVRAAFLAGEVPPELRAAVVEGLRTLGAEDAPVAVRSSATAEDLPEASFAGQQDTLLNQRGPDAVVDAVRRCWASLWNARAVAYRARQGIEPDRVALAVVVQRMVPATAAGVLFTVHPVTGRTDRMVINATWGLGEALVAGRVDPDTVVVHAATGRVIRYTRGAKAMETVPAPTGTAEVDVDPARRAGRVLDDSLVTRLAALGRALVDRFGGPQDVEWALAGGEPVLLQSRPVTAAPPSVPGDDAWPPLTHGEPQPFDFWTQQDMGERWPTPPTPLTWSVTEPLDQQILERMVAGLHAPWAGRVQWSRRAHGRVYMNEGALLHSFVHGFGMPLSMTRSGLTHPAAAPSDADRWRPGRVLRHLPFFWQAAFTWERNVGRFEADLPRIDGWVDAHTARDLAADDDAALLRDVREVWLPRLNEYLALHGNATSLAMSSYDQLEAFVLARGGDVALTQELMGGITGVMVAEMGPALAEMAATLERLGLAPKVADRPPAEALAELRAHPEAAPFLARLDAFLQRHGHRSAIEAELRAPRWIEAPEQVVEQLAPWLRGGARSSAAASAVERREAATSAFEARLGWWARPAFRRLLHRAHRFTRMRDNGQSYAIKLLLPLRRDFAELGRRWAKRGWLADPDDLFFLVMEDLVAAVDGGGAGLGLAARAEARRRAWAHWCAQPAPEALDAEGEPAPPPRSEDDPDVLAGVAASRGRVVGVARVVLSPQDAGRLAAGEILVTRATDPGWTPVFSVIGGAVLEVGGLLSHGAIVAREYGLPAVVNVSGATRTLRDGERIEVDGTAGRVRRLGSAFAD